MKQKKFVFYLNEKDIYGLADNKNLKQKINLIKNEEEFLELTKNIKLIMLITVLLKDSKF